MKTKTIYKEKINWPVTIILSVLAIFFILGPLYLTIVIALKEPIEMKNVLAWPKNIRWENFVDAWDAKNL